MLVPSCWGQHPVATMVDKEEDVAIQIMGNNRNEKHLQSP